LPTPVGLPPRMMRVSSPIDGQFVSTIRREAVEAVAARSRIAPPPKLVRRQCGRPRESKAVALNGAECTYIGCVFLAANCMRSVLLGSFPQRRLFPKRCLAASVDVGIRHITPMMVDTVRAV
jgi:hypothetical protein